MLRGPGRQWRQGEDGAGPQSARIVDQPSVRGGIGYVPPQPRVAVLVERDPSETVAPAHPPGLGMVGTLDRGYASVRHQRATYAAMITYLDTQVGIIADLVNRLGLDDNTIIMFSSDNGPQDCCGVDIEFFNSAGPLRASKGSIYEGGIRVPFIARWPGKIPAGGVSDFISVQYDMMSTIAEIVGIARPDNDGVSIFPSMMGRGDEQEQRPYLYWEFPSYGGQIAIRMGKWKAVRSELIKNPKNPWQLYNLDMDIGESNDVAGFHPELLEQFDRILKETHRPAHIREWNFIDQSLIYDIN